MKKKVLIVVENGFISEIYESHPDIEVEVVDLDCNDYEEAAKAKGNALCKIVCDDIYFFTNGLTKDYGGKE